MNHNASNNPRLFVDRQMSAKAPVGRASTLRLLAGDPSDFAETAMRVLLTLCLVASLVLAGWHTRRPQSNDRATGLQVPAWSQTVPQMPTLPTVQVRAALP